MSIRVDKWLWCVRIYKTRTIANEACSSGRVQVNGEGAKPATKLAVGDTVKVRRKDRTLIIEVVSLIEKRVSATLAAEAYLDLSPPLPEPARHGDFRAEPVVAKRDRGAGRPTKRERRQIEKFRKQD